jgi:hypothetical protein
MDSAMRKRARQGQVIRVSLMALAVVAGLTGGGCSRRSGPDTSAIEQAFLGAPEEERGYVKRALEAVKAQDLRRAEAELTTVTTSGRLTPLQSEQLREFILELRQRQAAETNGVGAGAASGTNRAGQ